MTKKQIRMIITLGVLLVVLAALAAYFYYYRNTKRLDFNIAASAEGVVQPPVFLYSFSGNADSRLQRPIGVVADGGKVYVADGVRHTIFVYDEAGKQLSSFGTSQTVVPLYMAKNPKDNLLYVTDRRDRTIHRFSLDGKYRGEFDPKLPKNQLPTFETGGVKWAPVAIAFANDGTMYVTEILKGHRLLIFGPDGKFKKSIGTAGMVNDPTKAEGMFQFPNGLLVYGNEVLVADSNNRRVQAFDLEGKHKRTIVTQGLPRGIALLDRFPSDGKNVPGRFVAIDTLAHDGTIWTTSGKEILKFGEQGTLDGQFNYPDAVARGTRNKLFITDTANGRVQVWGWPDQVARIPPIVNPNNLWVCLIPLLLLPLMMMMRKRRFVATPDFVNAMVLADAADIMPARRRQWLATETQYEEIKPVVYAGIDMGQLFRSSEFSESDAQALAQKLEIDQETAGILALAQRSKVFCTESTELRRLAKVLEIDVVNRDEFVSRFGTKQRADQQPPKSAA